MLARTAAVLNTPSTSFFSVSGLNYLVLDLNILYLNILTYIKRLVGKQLNTVVKIPYVNYLIG